MISDNGELTFRYAPDYDSPADSNRDNEYLVIVRAYDATNRYGSLDVTVTVRGENEADPVVTGNQTMSFREKHRHHDPPVYLPCLGCGPKYHDCLVGQRA